MAYVDGFIVAVPKKNLAAYRRMAKKAGKVWKDHGAIDYCECIADDVKVGKWTSFPRSVKLKRFTSERSTLFMGRPASVLRPPVAYAPYPARMYRALGFTAI